MQTQNPEPRDHTQQDAHVRAVGEHLRIELGRGAIDRETFRSEEEGEGVRIEGRQGLWCLR